MATSIKNPKSLAASPEPHNDVDEELSHIDRGHRDIEQVETLPHADEAHGDQDDDGTRGQPAAFSGRSGIHRT